MLASTANPPDFSERSRATPGPPDRQKAARPLSARRARTAAVTAWLTLTLLTGAVAAQETPRVGLRGTELHHLDSAILGERLEIDVGLPRGYADETVSYPVVYILDAETNFGATSYIARRLAKSGDIPSVLVVGVAYDTTYDDFYVKRARDLTPVARSRFPGSGGAGRFARFLEEELFPFVGTHYRVQASDRTLYGHSFGGLFAHYALLEHPGLFPRIVSLSPSVWYGDRYLLAAEQRAFEGGGGVTAVLYTAVGGDEPTHFVEDWRNLTDRLETRRYPGLQMKGERIAGENHRSIFGVGFTNGLRYVFSLPLPRITTDD